MFILQRIKKRINKIKEFFYGLKSLSKFFFIFFSLLFIFIFLIVTYIYLYGNITKEFKFYIFDMRCTLGYHSGFGTSGLSLNFHALHIPDIRFFIPKNTLDIFINTAINEYIIKYPNGVLPGDMNKDKTINIIKFIANHFYDPIFRDTLLQKFYDYFLIRYNAKPIEIKEFYSILDQYVSDSRESQKKFTATGVKNVVPFPELIYESILRNEEEFCSLILEYRSSMKLFFWFKYTSFSALFWYYAYIIFNFLMFFIKHK